MRKLIGICAVVAMALAAAPTQAVVTFDFQSATV
ncbi:unnamed protein product, partial [marine sediment metagenome]